MAARRRPAFTRRGQAVTYKRYLSSTTNFGTGVVTPTYESKSLSNVLVWDLDNATVIQSNGRYQIGDRAVRILKEDFPYDDPLTRDVIVVGGSDYTIVKSITTGDSQAVTVVIRKP